MTLNPYVILKTPAGPELDALLAEYVLGWGRWPSGFYDYSTDTLHETIPAFSSDLALALSLWARLDDLGYNGACPMLILDDGQWRSGVGYHNYEHGGYWLEAEGAAKEPALAVCRGLLRATMGRKR